MSSTLQFPWQQEAVIRHSQSLLYSFQHWTGRSYRPGRDVEVLESAITLSGEDVLPGFVLNLGKVW